ncbi:MULTISPECIES: hypothetical protein [Streptomyces]|uniref:hypothetical protein n=1 Tax=Streptomyces TaxID=1883 RepID=UPI00287FF168|nr:hypothetical protein [Streptomyces sp. CGMCC 4.1456]WNF67172.1 hypothetical protein RJD14_33425 [Streptomyces sp. CGMCC 4.1456]
MLDQLPASTREFTRDASWGLDFWELFEVIKDFDEAVALCTKGILRREGHVFDVAWGSKPHHEPDTYRNVLLTVLAIDHYHSRHWRGDLYRTVNGWVVLHWHTKRDFWDG